MITVIVKFSLADLPKREAIANDFSNISEMFYDIPDLLRKYFIISEDGMSAGGIYLWENRKSAEEFHGENFRLIIQERYGIAPEITIFNCPIVVDNQFSYEFQNIAA